MFENPKLDRDPKNLNILSPLVWWFWEVVFCWLLSSFWCNYMLYICLYLILGSSVLPRQRRRDVESAWGRRDPFGHAIPGMHLLRISRGDFYERLICVECSQCYLSSRWLKKVRLIHQSFGGYQSTVSRDLYPEWPEVGCHPFWLEGLIDRRFSFRSGTYKTSVSRVFSSFIFAMMSPCPDDLILCSLPTVTQVGVMAMFTNMPLFGVIERLAPELIIQTFLEGCYASVFLCCIWTCRVRVTVVLYLNLSSPCYCWTPRWRGVPDAFECSFNFEVLASFFFLPLMIWYHFGMPHPNLPILSRRLFLHLFSSTWCNPSSHVLSSRSKKDALFVIATILVTVLVSSLYLDFYSIALQRWKIFPEILRSHCNI